MNNAFWVGFGGILGILAGLGLITAVLSLGFLAQAFLRATYTVLKERRRGGR